MICPGSDVDCDNPGCRRGGCQGRPPRPPLLKLLDLDGPFALARRLSEAEPATAVPALNKEAVLA